MGNGKACGKHDAPQNGDEAYSSQGGVEPKPSMGMSWKHLTGKTGQTGFGSKSTAEQVRSRILHACRL